MVAHSQRDRESEKAENTTIARGTLENSLEIILFNPLKFLKAHMIQYAVAGYHHSKTPLLEIIRTFPCKKVPPKQPTKRTHQEDKGPKSYHLCCHIQ